MAMLAKYKLDIIYTCGNLVIEYSGQQSNAKSFILHLFLAHQRAIWVVVIEVCACTLLQSLQFLLLPGLLPVNLKKSSVHITYRQKH